MSVKRTLDTSNPQYRFRQGAEVKKPYESMWAVASKWTNLTSSSLQLFANN